MEGGNAMTTLISALTSGFQTIANDAISAIGSIVPYALPILGASLVITIAIRTFKKAGR